MQRGAVACATPLVLYGAGNPEAVKLVAAINRAAPMWELLGFIDDTPEKQGRDVLGVPVLGTAAYLDRLDLATVRFHNNVGVVDGGPAERVGAHDRRRLPLRHAGPSERRPDLLPGRRRDERRALGEPRSGERASASTAPSGSSPTWGTSPASQITCSSARASSSPAG